MNIGRRMRSSLLVFVVVAACSGGERPEAPTVCQSHCIVDQPVNSFEDCCDSITCWFDDDSDSWVITACDPPIADPCEACGVDELCVQSFDGTCGGGQPTCVPRTIDCPMNACTTECEEAYCGAPFQCMVRSPCGTESLLAFTCYGP